MQKSYFHRFGPIVLVLLVGFLGSWYLTSEVKLPQLGIVIPSATPTMTPVASPQVLGNFTLGVRTKTSGCIPNGEKPDYDCTPGAILPATKDQVCTPGYSATVRRVTEKVKRQVYAEYGIATHSAGQYEVDHFISLALGGSNDIANLWPEPALPTPGFHQKDVVENYLHKQVCDGVMPLEQAQREIATDWYSVYLKIEKTITEMPLSPVE